MLDLRRKKLIVAIIILLVVLIVGKIVVEVKEDLLLDKNEELLVESMDKCIEYYNKFMDSKDEKYLEDIIQELDICMNILGDMEGKEILNYNYSGMICNARNKLEAYMGKSLYMDYLLKAFNLIKDSAYASGGYGYFLSFANMNDVAEHD